MDDPGFIVQQLQLLLTAYGYNLYNSANRARADDLLVRERASGSLGDAARLLASLATEYSARRIPPSSREQPFPPADLMAHLKEIERLREEASVMSARIRGLSVPTQDRVWARFRDEATTLAQLLELDYRLVTTADAAYRGAEGLTVESWAAEPAAELQARLRAVEQAARDRERFLQLHVGTG